MTPKHCDTIHSVAKTSFFDKAFLLIKIEQKHPKKLRKRIKNITLSQLIRPKCAFYDKYFSSYDIFHKNDVIFTFDRDVSDVGLKKKSSYFLYDHLG